MKRVTLAELKPLKYVSNTLPALKCWSTLYIFHISGWRKLCGAARPRARPSWRGILLWWTIRRRWVGIMDTSYLLHTPPHSTRKSLEYTALSVNMRDNNWDISTTLGPFWTFHNVNGLGTWSSVFCCLFCFSCHFETAYVAWPLGLQEAIFPVLLIIFCRCSGDQDADGGGGAVHAGLAAAAAVRCPQPNIPGN